MAKNFPLFLNVKLFFLIIQRCLILVKENCDRRTIMTTVSLLDDWGVNIKIMQRWKMKKVNVLWSRKEHEFGNKKVLTTRNRPRERRSAAISSKWRDGDFTNRSR